MQSFPTRGTWIETSSNQIICFCFFVVPYAEADGKMLLHRLDLKEICIPTGSACDSVNTQVSHVIKAIKVPDEYAEGTIRITFGIDNREDEAARVSKTIATVLGKGGLRNVP